MFFKRLGLYRYKTKSTFSLVSRDLHFIPGLQERPVVSKYRRESIGLVEVKANKLQCSYSVKS